MSHCASACQTQLPVFILVIPVGQTVRTPSESNFGLGRTGKKSFFRFVMTYCDTNKINSTPWFSPGSWSHIFKLCRQGCQHNNHHIVLSRKKYATCKRYCWDIEPLSSAGICIFFLRQIAAVWFTWNIIKN